MDSILYTLNLARMGLHPWLLAAAPLGRKRDLGGSSTLTSSASRQQA